MSKITLDAETAAKLREAEPASELVGPDGIPLGMLVPSNLRYEVEQMIEYRRYAMNEADKIYTPEVLKELMKDMNDSIPHEDVIKDLGLE